MPYRILVVEDAKVLHQVYQLSLTRILKDGFEIYSALNGKEGLELLREHPDTDLILLDLNMPVMGGLDFLRVCRAHKDYNGIPIIIISTEGKRADLQRCIEAGAQDYLIKPIQAIDLQRLATKHLTGKSE